MVVNHSYNLYIHRSSGTFNVFDSIESWHTIFQDFLEMVKKLLDPMKKCNRKLKKGAGKSPGPLKKVPGLFLKVPGPPGLFAIALFHGI